MKDLGNLSYFLGCKVQQSKQGMMLTQTKYTKELIDLACLTDAKIVDTLTKVNLKYRKNYGDPIPDPSLYRKYHKNYPLLIR